MWKTRGSKHGYQKHPSNCHQVRRRWWSNLAIKLRSGTTWLSNPWIFVHPFTMWPRSFFTFVLFYSLTFKHPYRFWTSCCIPWPLYKRGGRLSVTSPNVLWLGYTPAPLVHRYYLVALVQKEASHGNPHFVVWWFFFFYGFLGAFTHSTSEPFPLHLTNYICPSSQTRRVSRMESMEAWTQTLSQGI